MKKLISIRKAFGAFILAMALWFIGDVTYLVIDGLNDEIFESDVAVILGTKVHSNGMLSERLKTRVDRGYELYEDKTVRKIIVSGARGVEGHNEAIKMKEYLVEKGIPEQDIIADTSGANTYKTAENFKVIAEQNDFTSVLVVSQYFHLRRTKMIFRKMGFEKVGGVHAPFFKPGDLWYVPREFFAFYYYWFKY